MRFSSLNRSISLLALLSCTHVACDSGTTGAMMNPDGGEGGGGNNDGGGSTYTGPTRTVLGTRIRTNITDSGKTNFPIDLSKYSISIFYRLPAGNSLARIGTGQADGTFKIEDVPVGSYWLRLQGNPVNGQVQPVMWVNSSSDNLDLGADFAGRGDTVLPAQHSNLVVNMTKMTTWQPDDDLEFFVPNAGGIYSLQNETFYPTQGGPVVGDQALRSFTVDFAINAIPLIDSDKRDQAYLTKVGASGNPVGLYTVKQYFKPTTFKMTDGSSSSVGGDFTDVPQDQRVTANWQRSKYAALDLSISPQTDSIGIHYLGATAYGSPTDAGIVGGAADLFYYNTDTQTDANVDFVYGNPFTTGFTRVFGASYRRTLHFKAPGASMDAYLPGTLSSVSLTAPSTVAPVLSPVTGIKVDGKDANVALTGISNTPTLSFTPPTTGTAAGYVIQVVRFGVNSRGGTQIASISELYSTQTSLVVPPGVLDNSSLYVFIIKARSLQGVDLESSPFRRRVPTATADALTQTILTK